MGHHPGVATGQAMDHRLEAVTVYHPGVVTEDLILHHPGVVTLLEAATEDKCRIKRQDNAGARLVVGQGEDKGSVAWRRTNQGFEVIILRILLSILV